MTDPPRRIRLVTEWSTDDPQLAETLKLIASEPEWSVVRHEMEAGLHMMQARFAWRRADQLREQQRQQDAREERRARNHYPGPAVCTGCRRTLSVRSDGTMRKHNGPAGTAECPGSRQPPVVA